MNAVKVLKVTDPWDFVLRDLSVDPDGEEFRLFEERLNEACEKSVLSSILPKKGQVIGCLKRLNSGWFHNPLIFLFLKGV